jgi:hypothetical protein
VRISCRAGAWTAKHREFTGQFPRDQNTPQSESIAWTTGKLDEKDMGRIEELRMILGGWRRVHGDVN